MKNLLETESLPNVRILFQQMKYVNICISKHVKYINRKPANANIYAQEYFIYDHPYIHSHFHIPSW